MTVDSRGQATSAAVYRTPDRDLGRYAAHVLLREKNKPAVCAGAPCEMVSPFRITLSIRQ